MREIRFRAKAMRDYFRMSNGTYRLPQGTWVYGCLIRDFDEFPMIDIQGYVDGSGVHYQYYVDPQTVGQFTGMYDKNGKEIYEGDILLSKDEYGTVEVIFAHGAFQVRYFCKNGEHRIPFTNLKKDYELLGNIHDNPGLLNAVGYKFKENKEGGEK